MLDGLIKQLSVIAALRKAAPVAYMGPDRQLYADPDHTQPWKPDYSQPGHARIQAMAEQVRFAAIRQVEISVRRSQGERRADPSVRGSRATSYRNPRDKALFHSTPAANMASIKAHGLLAARGGRTWGGAYEGHSQGRVFFSSTPEVARQWHNKTADALDSKLVGNQQLGRNPVVMLRAKDRPVESDKMPGGVLGSESHFTTSDVPPEELEFYHGKSKRWMPIKSWRPGAHSTPEEGEDYLPRGVGASA